MLFVLLFYIALMFLAGMGLAFTRSSVPGGKTEDGMDDETAEQSCPAGKLMLLSDPFAGQQIPLPAGEELCLGNDPADCQLILDLPEKGLGANIHASIGGTVAEVTPTYVEVRA